MIFDWFAISDVGLPSRKECELYGERYSHPVIAANEHTGQVICDVIYDFEDEGWCPRGLPEGMSCHCYEMPHITHWGCIPEFVKP